MKTQLKPCPFCGSKAKYKYIIDGDNEGAEYVECTNCGASTNLTFPIKDDVKEIVIEKWNRRIQALTPINH